MARLIIGLAIVAVVSIGVVNLLSVLDTSHNKNNVVVPPVKQTTSIPPISQSSNGKQEVYTTSLHPQAFMDGSSGCPAGSSSNTVVQVVTKTTSGTKTTQTIHC